MNRRQVLFAGSAACAVYLRGDIARADDNLVVPFAMARAVRDGWGVCGRPGSDASIEAYAEMLASIQTSDLRCPVISGGRTLLPDLLSLQTSMRERSGPASALRLTALVTAYLNDPASSWADQKVILASAARKNILYSIEGPNEINNTVTGGGSHPPNSLVDWTGPRDYPKNFLAWSKALSEFKRGEQAALSKVFSISPSIASGLSSDYSVLPNVSNLVDYGNVHFYAGGGRQPNFSTQANPSLGSFENIVAWARLAEMGHKAVWLTECGASTSGNYAKSGVSQAKYILNQLFNYFAIGGKKLFIYDLIDQKGSPTDYESNFGLFSRDGSPKLSAVALSRLQNLLSEKANTLSGSNNNTMQRDLSSLTWSFDDKSPERVPRLLVMSKSDHDMIVAVWNEARIDDRHGRDLDPSPSEVSLNFGSPRRYQVHDLIDDRTSHENRFAKATSVPLLLKGYPLLVEISGES